MKQFTWLLIILAGSFASAVSAQTPAAPKATPYPKLEQELRQTEQARFDAYNSGDAKALEKLLADDFLITYENGAVSDKKQFLAKLTPKDPNLKQYTENASVRIYHKTAIVTGTYIRQQRTGEQEFVRRFRYTDTYRRHKGHWQLIAAHLSPLLIR